MRKVLLVAPALILGACAGTALDPQCWDRMGRQTCVRDPNYGIVTAQGRAVTEEGKQKQAQDEDWARQRAGERKQQAEQLERESQARSAERKQQTATQQAAADARKAADEARGYPHVSFKDLLLDYKTMPLGTKRAVSGNYRVYGELEALLDSPQLDVSRRIVLLTGSAPRAVRAKLLEQPCQIGLCRVVLLGHTVACTLTQPGVPVRSDICFAVDDMW